MDASWYVIHSKPRKETQIYSYLSKEIEVFYPNVEVKPVNPCASRYDRLFRVIYFVYVYLDEVGKSALEWIPGAVGLVSFGGEPAVVTGHFVHELKQHSSIAFAALGSVVA